jgi:uncharacterized membrane protein
MDCYTSGCGTVDVAWWRSVKERVGDERTRVAWLHTDTVKKHVKFIYLLAQVLAFILLIFYFLWQTTQDVSVAGKYSVVRLHARTDVSISRRSVLSQTFTCHYYS